MTTWPGRRALIAALCLVMIALPLSLDGLDFRAYGGYPAVGFAVALLVYAERHGLWWALTAETAVITAALSRTYDLHPLLGLVGSASLTLPAYVVWRLLTRNGTVTFEMDSILGERRFFVATALGAAVCAAIGGTLSLFEVSAGDALLTTLMAFVSALAAQLSVLPILSDGSRSAAGNKAERILQWVMLLGVSVVVFWPQGPLTMLFVILTVLGWGANRGSPRSSHLQVMLVSVVAYALTFTGHGPLAGTPAGMPISANPILLYLFIMSCAYLTIPISASISRQQLASAESTRSASTMERLLESARQTLIITTDPYGRITRVNRGAELILGYGSEELLGQSPAVLHPEEEIARHARRMGLPEDDFAQVALAMAASGERWDWEIVTRAGPRYLSLSVTPIDGDEGSVVGYVAVGDDTTERHAAHEAMRAALEHEHASVKRLREVDRVKRELVSNVSHELRTPITSIHGYAELLADGAIGRLTGDQLEVVARIDRNSQRLIRLVEDLLTLSKLESGALVLHRSPTDLGELVREVGLLLEEQLRAGELDLRLHVPDVPVTLRADAHELERVLVNLVGNSIKFTPDGGSIDVTLSADSESAVITVSDTGLGIALDEQEQLFGRFFRASSAIDNAIQGTGLGLSIAHAIVTAHGGTISVESEPGAGTTMRVCLPLEDDEVADEPLFRH